MISQSEGRQKFSYYSPASNISVLGRNLSMGMKYIYISLRMNCMVQFEGAIHDVELPFLKAVQETKHVLVALAGEPRPMRGFYMESDFTSTFSQHRPTTQWYSLTVSSPLPEVLTNIHINIRQHCSGGEQYWGVEWEGSKSRIYVANHHPDNLGKFSSPFYLMATFCVKWG